MINVLSLTTLSAQSITLLYSLQRFELADCNEKHNPTTYSRDNKRVFNWLKLYYRWTIAFNHTP